jgi:hypothetical protein
LTGQSEKDLLASRDDRIAIAYRLQNHRLWRKAASRPAEP